MRDHPSDERPLSLGALAETESPEIVRAALGRFRRRFLMRGLVLLLAVGAAFVLYPRYFNDPKQLAQEILDARGTMDFIGEPIRDGDVYATLFKIARLSRQPETGERYGIFMLVSSERLNSGEQITVAPNVGRGVLQVQTGQRSPFVSGIELWISVSPGTRIVEVPFSGVVSNGSGLAVAHPSLGTLRLDMEQLDVPDWIWR